MTSFIDDHRAAHGVSAICKVLQVAPSGYYARLAVRVDPAKASVRQQTDARLRPKIRKFWDDNWQVYRVRKGEPLKRHWFKPNGERGSCAGKAWMLRVARWPGLWRAWI